MESVVVVVALSVLAFAATNLDNLIVLVGVVLLSGASICLGADDEKIDRDKARQLRQKERKGETLTVEEKSYLNRARQSRMRSRPDGVPGGMDFDIRTRQAHGG